VKILVDTHIFLWALADPSRLGGKYRALLESRANEVFVSAVSVTELSIKHSIGKIEISFDVMEAIETVGFEPLDFSCEDALLLKELPFHHRDPFDRMLVAQAKRRGLALMTADEKLKLYDCALIIV
jgi:PIN domain nuclease of toxin-antitoxin system